jgi:hypothetical protein
MKKIRCLYKIRLLSHFGIQAITLYPFVLFAGTKKEISAELFRHELEHIYQVQRMGWWKFYFSYLRFYFEFRMNGKNHQLAYWNIPYEIEARNKETAPLSKAEKDFWGAHFS